MMLQVHGTCCVFCLVPEAMWTATGEVVEVPPPTDDEVVGVLRRVLTLARRDFEAEEAAFGAEEDEYGALQAAAVQRPLALEESPPRRRRPAKRVAVAQGFSLHADTAVHGHDRQGLERLARYGARGPLAESRLRRLEDGRYEYTPKRGEAFVVTAEALVKRLVALTPPARRHLTSFHGVYGPNARLAAGGDAGARRGRRAAAGTEDEGDEAEAAAAGLGDAAPAHLRDGRAAVSMWRAADGAAAAHRRQAGGGAVGGVGAPPPQPAASAGDGATAAGAGRRVGHPPPPRRHRAGRVPDGRKPGPPAAGNPAPLGRQRAFRRRSLASRFLTHSPVCSFVLPLLPERQVAVLSRWIWSSDCNTGARRSGSDGRQDSADECVESVTRGWVGIGVKSERRSVWDGHLNCGFRRGKNGGFVVQVPGTL